MTTIKNKKEFDSVKMMRDIRDELSIKFKDMDFEQQKEYLRKQLKKNSNSS